MTILRPTTDGLITIRPPHPGEAEALIAGRDVEFHRFLGEGDPEPKPLGCIELGGNGVGDNVIGWVDYDLDRSWLKPGEVNVGYNVFAPHRGRGYATRAVQLLMHHLAVDTDHRVATLLIDAKNSRSLALADRARFPRVPDLDGHPYFKRPVPPLTYSDGVVTIRRLGPDDLDTHIEATDDLQISWLWLPGERESWEAMSTAAQRAHMLRYLERAGASFGVGPKWIFAADTADAQYVAYIDCDLANDHVPLGEANISYTAHPAHRGIGHVRRAVALLLDFLRDHTGAREAHIIPDDENEASLRVAHAAGAVETEAWVNDQGRTLVRHVIDL